jgi:hypothetical protein
MKRRTLYLLGVIVCAAVAFYLSFGQEPQLHLWTWFGYKFGINLNTQNLTVKVLLLAFIALFINNQRKTNALEKSKA